MKLRKIISGGQTGADRGGLDAAIECGLEHGGYCPRGRRSEDGSVPARYALTETESWGYGARTRQNVADSDGTLIFTGSRPGPGSELTAEIALELAKPHMHLLSFGKGNPDHSLQFDGVERGKWVAPSVALATWIVEEEIVILNIAGSRESSVPGIQVEVREILVETIAELRRRTSP